jgi:hypothetical protein
VNARYDTVLKSLLIGSESQFLQLTASAAVDRWVDVELPQTQQTRVDLLGETAENPPQLIHLELQSGNDPLMPLRMAEYSLRVYRIKKRFPRQLVLYVGLPKMRMPSELVGPNHVCRYEIIDIRSIDEQILLNSPFLSDNILAILARHGGRKETIRRILERIAKLKGDARKLAFKKLTILAGLRKLGDTIQAEVRNMPILEDIMDHDLLGPAIRQGMKQGLQEGLKQGQHQQGLATLRKLVLKRFGKLPDWADERLAKMSARRLQSLSVKLLDAKSLEELLA